MTYLTIIVLMLVAFTVVGWPLISSAHASAPQPGKASRLDALSGQRDAAYRAIKELEFEHELRNLSDSDYQSLRERYRSEAAAILRKLDAAVKEGAAPSGDTTGATQIASVASRQAGLSCPSCGKPRDVSDRFCWSCGAQLGRGCPDCGGPVQAEDRFCASCGARLEAERNSHD
jgi:hypothetical protein